MYIIGFIFNLSYAIPVYINSSFLSTFASDRLVGIIYVASSILAIMAFIEISNVLRRLGNLRTTIILLVLEIVSLTGLVVGHEAISLISSFLLNFVTIALINFTIDVFLEEFSTDNRTGKIRGTFLTMTNGAWLFAPLIASCILGTNGLYSNVYLLSAVLIVPVILLLFINLRGIKDPPHERLAFWKSFSEVWADKDIKSVLFVEFLLQFFYAWMIIYTPIYLHTIVGFDWPTIGVIFVIMLLPFVLLQEFLGRAADKYGEKKMLAIGFIIIGISTASIAFLTDHNAIVWALVLFATRVGAAIIEVMADTYFFKKIDASKTHIISFSRMARPLAYVISPILATILFTVFDMKGLFIFLGLLMFYGLRYVFVMTDTRKAG